MRLAAKIVALAAILPPCSPAWASVYTVDWTGTIYDGFDSSGVFGPSGSLIGQTAHLTFQVDTGTPGAIHQSDAFGTLVGGHDSTSPVSASVTINGVTHQIITHDVYVPTYPFEIYEVNKTYTTNGFAAEADYVPGDDEISQGVDQLDDVQVFDAIGNSIVNTFNNFAFAKVDSYLYDISDGDVETPPKSHTMTIDDNIYTSYFNIFQIYEEYYIDRDVNVVYRDVAYGKFIPASFTVTADGAGSAAAPEPASWALMLLGFGAVGGVLRKGRPNRRFTF